MNWRGGRWTERAAIYEGHREIHATFYRNTVAKVQRIEVLDFLSPTVAYVLVRSDMTGDERDPPGKTNRYRRSMTLTNKGGVWLIQKGHNTRMHDDLN